MQVGHICWGSRGSIEVMPHWGGAEHETVTWGQTGWSSWGGRSLSKPSGLVQAQGPGGGGEGEIRSQSKAQIELGLMGRCGRGSQG